MPEKDILPSKNTHHLESRSVETFRTLFHRETGKPAAKWQGYLQHYDRHFTALKHKPLRLLEIGVQAGGSLEVWAQYFKSATHIIGCDIDPACGELRYEDPRIKILIGDINTPEMRQSLISITTNLDVVIDDSSHQSLDIIRSFLQLFPHLNAGGIYMIEDLHCSYWENYGGGLYDPFSAISFFKKIVDTLNQSIWGVQIESKEFFSDFHSLLGDSNQTIDWSFTKEIHSIEFVNSMCVITKQAASSNLLGKLALSGLKDNTKRSNFQYTPTEMTVVDQSNNLFSKKHDEHELIIAQISNAREKIAYLSNKLLCQQKEIESTQNQLYKSATLISELEDTKLKLTTQVYESTKQFYEACVSIQLLEFKIKQLENSNQNSN